MYFPKVAFGLACTVAVAASSPATSEDLTVFFKVTGGTNGTTASYWSTIRTRTDHEHYTNIRDAADGNFIMIDIDHQKREYSETTLEEIEAATRRARQRAADARAKLNEMYAKQGKQAPPRPSASASLDKLADHRTIVGYDCEHYVLTSTLSLDGDVKSITKWDHWITPVLRRPPSSWPIAEESEFAEIARVGKELANKGLSLAVTMTISNPSGSFSSSTEAIEVKKGAIDPSVFAVPAGYTRVASPFTKDAP